MILVFSRSPWCGEDNIDGQADSKGTNTPSTTSRWLPLARKSMYLRAV